MVISKAKDAVFWEKVRTEEAYRPFREELAAMWEKECGRPVPACKYCEFIIYNQSGSRREYEASYFLRRRQMNVSALLSLIYPEEHTYLSFLCDVIWAILDEYVWVLPAHMPSFSENIVEHIDLFAAETGFALSEIGYLLEARLPELIRSRIQTEVNRRILEAYQNHTYWWEASSANWAAVCLCGVVGACMYQRPERLEAWMPRIRETVRCFLSGFTEEGVCLEGLEYWHYGFGFFTCMADMLYDFTDGAVDFFADAKVERIAGFAQKMFLNRNVAVSFSDTGIYGRYHIGLVHYLKGKYPGTISVLPRRYAYTNDNCGRWCLHLRALLWFDASLSDTPCDQNYTEYMQGAGWLIKITPEYGFAAKGGVNAEPHNHNDLGSFIVAKDGLQILTDPGAGVYTREYFKKQRYADFCASSCGHSVPVINGCCQSSGRERRAETSFENGVFSIEFAKGYDISALTSLVRSFSFSKDGVVLRDAFRGGGIESFVERFVTGIEPEMTGGEIKIASSLLTADMDNVDACEIKAVTYADRVYYCIDYTLKKCARAFVLKICI